MQTRQPDLAALALAACASHESCAGYGTLLARTTAPTSMWSMRAQRSIVGHRPLRKFSRTVRSCGMWVRYLVAGAPGALIPVA